MNFECVGFFGWNLITCYVPIDNRNGKHRRQFQFFNNKTKKSRKKPHELFKNRESSLLNGKRQFFGFSSRNIEKLFWFIIITEPISKVWRISNAFRIKYHFRFHRHPIINKKYRSSNYYLFHVVFGLFRWRTGYSV